MVGAELPDDALHVARDGDGVPQQVIAPGAGLEGERLHGSAAGRIEEAAQ